MSRFNLDDEQAQSILDMQLKRLSGLNREKILSEHKELTIACENYKEILADDGKKKEIIEAELLEIKTKYADKRKSEISLQTEINIENEDLIPKENVIITVTNRGYVKRMKLSEYKSQARGGVGITGMKTHSDDDVRIILPTLTHDYLLFFTNKGRVYAIKGYQIPEGNRTSKGIPVVNILQFQEDEKLAAITPVESLDDDNKYLFFVTKKGTVKRTQLSQFKNIRTSGIIAIGLDENDELLQVECTDGNRDIVLGASNGKAIHFHETQIRAIGRSGAGVRGMLLGDEDYIVGAAVVTDEKSEILVVTTKGFGKRSTIDEYRLQGRGGSGVKAMNTTAKNGELTCLTSVSKDNDLIITTDKGMVIRMHVEDISQTGRNTQGVILVKLKDNHNIATIAVVMKEDEIIEENNVEVVETTENTENKDSSSNTEVTTE